MSSEPDLETGVPAPPSLSWYLVHTQGRLETLVLDRFERKGWGAYLPMNTRFAVHARRQEVVSRPLFPTYLFVGLDRRTPPFSEVRKTHGVRWIVSRDGVPVVVPERVVADLQQAEILGLFDETIERPEAKAADRLKVGDQVKLVGGPLPDMAATIVALPSERRVEVVLKGLGIRQPRVTVPVARVRRTG